MELGKKNCIDQIKLDLKNWDLSKKVIPLRSPDFTHEIANPRLRLAAEHSSGAWAKKHIKM